MRHEQRKFGVEIECVADSHVGAEVVRQWPQWSWHHEHCGIEIVSPPLTQARGMEQLAEVLDWLKPRANVSNACGGHVHLEASDLTPADVRRFVYSWENNQGHIMQMVAPSRHSNGYAKLWTSGELERLSLATKPIPKTADEPEPESPTGWAFTHGMGWQYEIDGMRRWEWDAPMEARRTLAAYMRIHEAWTLRNPYAARRLDTPSQARARRAQRDRYARNHQRFGRITGFDRYKTVNVAALREHGTIEIRQGHATLEATEAEAWIKFCMRFMCDVVDRKRVLKAYKTPANLMRFVKVDANVVPIMNEKIAKGGRWSAAPEMDDPDEYDGDGDSYDDDYYDDSDW